MSRPWKRWWWKWNMIPKKPHLVGLQVLCYILSSYFIVPLTGSFITMMTENLLIVMKKKRFGWRVVWREEELFWKLKGESLCCTRQNYSLHGVTSRSCAGWSLAGSAGKLTVAQIKAGYESLKKIEDCIRADQQGRALMEACNEFYTRIPHDFGYGLYCYFTLVFYPVYPLHHSSNYNNLFNLSILCHLK